jgi:hypothetical protein
MKTKLEHEREAFIKWLESGVFVLDPEKMKWYNTKLKPYQTRLYITFDELFEHFKKELKRDVVYLANNLYIDLISGLGLKKGNYPKYTCVKPFVNKSHMNFCKDDILWEGDEFLFCPERPEIFMHKTWVNSPDFNEYFTKI